MKKFSKSTWFSIFLLVIAFLEGTVLIYNLFHPNKDKFSLDAQEFAVPARDITVKPFLFEIQSAKQAEAILDDTEDTVSNGLLKQIIDNSSNNEGAVRLPLKHHFSANDTTSSVIDPDSSQQMHRIAIVIDDMGVSIPYTQQIIDIKQPLTASFLAYGPANKKQVEAAQAAGFEVMLHVPMMPHVPAALAPITLSPEMSKAEIQGHISKMLKRYAGTDMRGINNHMGSLFTEKPEPMRYVMEFLCDNHLFFLDSLTTGKSVGRKVAAEYKVPYITRDVFLDNENKYDYIMGQLRQTERVAYKKGYAVAIGHPHSETIRALNDWVKTLKDKNLRLVHLSELLHK